MQYIQYHVQVHPGHEAPLSPGIHHISSVYWQYTGAAPAHIFLFQHGTHLFCDCRRGLCDLAADYDPVSASYRHGVNIQLLGRLSGQEVMCMHTYVHALWCMYTRHTYSTYMVHTSIFSTFITTCWHTILCFECCFNQHIRCIMHVASFTLYICL
jgi:hypothetical protein